MSHPTRIVLIAVVLLAAWGTLRAGDLDRLKVQRQEVFEFSAKPTVTRDGDRVTIAFKSKAFCDATVAIEDGEGKIVRHLASGVLGPDAPPPFAKNALAQTLTWDGKDDRGRYVQVDAMTVRVSLGLQPRLERTLYWSPHKRAGQALGKGVSIAAAPEGVYVFDGGQAADHLRLFNHDGDYLRTIYPFPAGRVGDVKGLIWHKFPQDGRRLPVKPTYQMVTFLAIGENAKYICFNDGRYSVGAMDPAHKGEYGHATTDLAVVGKRIAMGAFRLGRLSTDGDSGGLELIGPNVDLRKENGFYKATDSAMSVKLGGYSLLTNLRPHRFALSPDGKSVYLTRYIQNYALDMYVHNFWKHGVWRVDYDAAPGSEPELFLGAEDEGKDDAHFNMPSDLACDAQGRIYVADNGNNRIQVFTPDRKLVKSIRVPWPAQISVSPKTGEIYVLCARLMPKSYVPARDFDRSYTLRRLKSLDDPKVEATWDLPLADTGGRYEQCMEVDFWSDPVQIWVSPGAYPNPHPQGRPIPTGILLLQDKGGKLDIVRDFRDDVRKTVVQNVAPGSNRQRLYFDPRHEKLYVGEGGFYFRDAIEINPANGKTRLVNLPFDAEDMCFDIDGFAIVRTNRLVARYDPVTWREVPWDYGEEHEKVSYNVNSDRRTANVASAIALPVNSGWHHGGMNVAPNGDMVVGCLYRYGPAGKGPSGQEALEGGKSYAPRLYPGRVVMAAYGVEYIHVWDRHGRLIREDVVPGLGTLNGVGIDSRGSVYVLSAAPRMVDGKPWFNFLAGTLIKFGPDGGKLVSDDPQAPIKLTEVPQRPADLSNLPGSGWVSGAEWMFPGVGWMGKNHGLGCGCRNTRFALDYFARSFAPEIDRYSIAVLDAAGNVITRIGSYGNVDDGRPLVADGGPPATRSIGGDEVSLMHGAYVATQSDRRVFIADIGNYRVVSVKLDYHATESVPVKP